MSQVMTNYTTYDLAYYYADLARVPRLSEEEKQKLLAATAQTTRLHDQARNRLIEGHLSLATHIAIDRCPPAYYRSLPDILGEVAFTLVKVTDRYDFQAGKDFTSYVVACTEGAMKRAIGSDRLIRIPSTTIWAAKQKGTVEQLYDLQPDSLDKWMEWYNTDELEEPPTAPLLPTQEAPFRKPELRAQVQAWLSYLSPRAQQVLTLRYGLADEDERCFTTTEICREIGLKRQNVQYIERDAIKRMKALAEGTATIIEKKGKPQVAGVYQFKPPTLTPEHEVIFRQAVTRLCEQGRKVSICTLAQEAKKSIGLAKVFLRLHRDQLPLSARTKPTHQERLALVAQIYAELQAKGEQISAERLTKRAHVSKKIALEFLREQRRKSDAAVQAR